MRAERLPIGADDRDLLNGRCVERSLPHHFDLAGLARTDPLCRQFVERTDGLVQACLGERNGAARRAVSLAEARLHQTIGALNELAAKGVGSCEPSQVEMMRQAAFDTSTIKEIAIIGPDGQTLCTHLG